METAIHLTEPQARALSILIARSDGDPAYSGSEFADRMWPNGFGSIAAKQMSGGRMLFNLVKRNFARPTGSRFDNTHNGYVITDAGRDALKSHLLAVNEIASQKDVPLISDFGTERSRVTTGDNITVNLNEGRFQTVVIARRGANVYTDDGIFNESQVSAPLPEESPSDDIFDNQEVFFVLYRNAVQNILPEVDTTLPGHPVVLKVTNDAEAFWILHESVFIAGVLSENKDDAESAILNFVASLSAQSGVNVDYSISQEQHPVYTGVVQNIVIAQYWIPASREAIDFMFDSGAETHNAPLRLADGAQTYDFAAVNH